VALARLRKGGRAVNSDFRERRAVKLRFTLAGRFGRILAVRPFETGSPKGRAGNRLQNAI